MKKNLAIILAGGTGSRIDGDLPKQFLTLAGKPILHHTVMKFETHPHIHDIFLVTNGEFVDKSREILRKGGFKKVVKVLNGGDTRQGSSRIGITAAGPDAYENVLIHDAARPFVSKKIIDDVLEKLDTYAAVNVAVPSPDTIIRVDDRDFIEDVPDRRYLRRVQTPQGFKPALMREAHRWAVENNIVNATDDCSLILESNPAPIYVVEGSPLNIKITYPLDLQMAEKILELESEKKPKIW